MTGTTLRRRVTDRLLEHLQQACDHNPHMVTADLFDAGFGGSDGEYENVQWCLRCGAARLSYSWQGQDKTTDWHEPRASWTWFRLGRGDRDVPGPWWLRRVVVTLLPDRFMPRVER